MKKLLTLLVVSSIGACAFNQDESTKKTTETKTEKSTNSDPILSYVKYPLNKVGYITELNNESDENYFKKTINDLQEKYNLTIAGSEDQADEISFGTTRVYSVSKPDHLKKAFQRLDDTNVGLTFVENKEYLNKLLDAKANEEEINIWEEVMEKKIYDGYMVMIGDNSQYYLTKDDAIGTGDNKWHWKSDKIATFAYSEVVSAYYMGYTTQYSFGLTSDGDKKSVGYILGAIYNREDDNANANRIKNIKKALAFRQGVLDAVKEKGTGAATFASKTLVSEDPYQQKLVWEDTEAEDDVFDKLAVSPDYKNKDHSFTYIAGATTDFNEIIATQLSEFTVKNSQGHKLIGEESSATPGYIFDSINDTNYIKAIEISDDGEEDIIKNKSVTARISMFYNEDSIAYKNNSYNTKLANTSAIKNVLKSIFEDDNLAPYFGKHTYVGTFPIVYKPGEYEIPANSQEANPISDEIKNELINKEITEEQFNVESDFLGWSE